MEIIELKNKLDLLLCNKNYKYISVYYYNRKKYYIDYNILNYYYKNNIIWRTEDYTLPGTFNKFIDDFGDFCDCSYKHYVILVYIIILFYVKFLRQIAKVKVQSKS